MTAFAALASAPEGGSLAALPHAVLAAVEPAKVQTGVIGMVVFLLLGAATFLLLRSFRHQMRKVERADLPHEKPRPHGPRPGVRLPTEQQDDESPDEQTPSR